MGLRGKKKWSKKEIARKSGHNESKIKVLRFLKKSIKPIDSESIAMALKWTREHANSLLLRYYRDGLVDREPIVKVLGMRYPIRLPYLYRITPKGIRQLEYIS